MRLGACVIAATALGGCAAHRPPAAALSPASVETFVEKVRQLSAAARPPRSNEADTLERRDPELSEARLMLVVAPTAGNHRRVAEAYARLGVFDAAYDHFSAALRLEPHDAASDDGLARIWRDWGFPHLGLTDAYRAIYYAPDSPVPQNTLGTLLLKMGRPAEARRAFERALALDPRAPYVLNNLCYTDLLTGYSAPAIARCRSAVRAQPDLTAAHNNLALAYAAAGEMAAAAQEFSLATSLAAARYNMGVALMATRRFDAAARAFDDAATLIPSVAHARDRARQARTLATGSAAERVDDHKTR